MSRKYRATANLEMARAMRGKRTSNAAGVHGDRRTKRLRDRSSRRREAIRDQCADTNRYD